MVDDLPPRTFDTAFALRISLKFIRADLARRNSGIVIETAELGQHLKVWNRKGRVHRSLSDPTPSNPTEEAMHSFGARTAAQTQPTVGESRKGEKQRRAS
jgi:hypothetical protein